MLDLSKLEAELTGITSAVDAIELLLKRLLDEAEANKGNPQAIQALVDKTRVEKDRLVAAALAGTPAEPA